MKAAIIAARQENLGLAKDDKTLLWFSRASSPNMAWGLREAKRAAPSCGDKTAASKRRACKAFGTGKDNVSDQNAGARALPPAAAAAAGLAAPRQPTPKVDCVAPVAFGRRGPNRGLSLRLPHLLWTGLLHLCRTAGPRARPRARP